jgi:hypothetical protein
MVNDLDRELAPAARILFSPVRQVNKLGRWVLPENRVAPDRGIGTTVQGGLRD